VTIAPPLASTLPALVLAARDRVRAYVRETPCDVSLALSARYGADIWLKAEHLQHTGSFKARGATHKLLCLTQDERRAGVVTASSGNHGAGVAWAARALGVRALVCVPQGASPAKVEMIQRYGADIHVHGTDGLDTELFARQLAADRGLPYVSPYNDPDIVAGQGTVGVEIAEEMSQVDSLIVAVGGGGLVSGTAAYLKSRLPNVRVIGALPENSPVMALSVRAGHVVEFNSEPTLSDGTAGGVEADSITFDLCRALVDDWVLVSEQEIATAMRDFIAEHHQLIEGAAAVALAALARKAGDLRGQRVAVILCGANVSLETLRKVLGA
jgi:threonine dehydratase